MSRIRIAERRAGSRSIMEPGGPLLDLLAVATVVIACVLVFSGTLSCYFLADDLLCLEYLAKIFGGHSELALSRMFSPWEHASVNLFWRPLADVTLMLDYLIWKKHAFGYHLTNLCLHTVASCLLYFLARRVLSGESSGRAAACCAALIFAVHPLRVEPVTWIVGRIDLLCGVFFFGAFLSFLKWRDGSLRGGLSLCAVLYILGLLSKEATVTLPVVTSAYLLIVDRRTDRWQALRQSLLVLAPAALVVLSVRALVLGHPVGGYQGNYGHYFLSTWLDRLRNPALLQMMLFPTNQRVWEGPDAPNICLRVFYIASGLLLAARAFLCPPVSAVWRTILFATVWLLITSLPTITVFHLGATLVGSRLTYVTSAPISLLLMALVFPCASRVSGATSWISRAAFCAMSAGTMIFGWVSVETVKVWQEASCRLRRIQEQMVARLQAMPEERKLVVVNFPSQFRGAHMAYVADELKTLVSPPLVHRDFSERLAFVDYMISGNTTNVARLLRYMKDPARFEVDYLDSRLTLRPYRRLPRAMYLAECHEEASRDGSGLRYAIKLSGESKGAPIEFLKVTVSTTASGTFRGWKPCMWFGVGDNDDAVDNALVMRTMADGRAHCYHLPLLQNKNWLVAESPQAAVLAFPSSGYTQRLMAVEPLFLGESPRIEPASGSLVEGCCTFCKVGRSRPACFKVDATGVREAVSARLDISRPSEYFDFPGDFEKVPLSSDHCLTSLSVPVKGDVVVPRTALPDPPARCQVRCCAVNARGKAVGFYSDPVALELE